MEIFKSIVTNVLTALYQPFWFAVLLTIFILFFYMYAYHPTDAGKGIKSACLAWIRIFKNSLFFRKLFCLVFSPSRGRRAECPPRRAPTS